MSRQLIYGNDIISFTPSTGIIVVKGYVPLQKLLIVNNATRNLNLYSFSDPLVTAVCTFNSVTNTTSIDVSTNTTSMSSSDKIQIYYEKEELEIKPARTYRDPVSKFRVSTPETLIDTDFEYGLQPTKWETVRLVNNVPTSYVAQTSEEALTIDNITVSSNSDIVTVTTSTTNNLIKGSVVDVVGLKDPKYEGTYIVKDVTDNRTFSYKVPFKTLNAKNLYTIYSLIYPGSFYTGSAVEISDLSTDGTDSSTLTVSTGYRHGFRDGTKLYLKKSRTTKSFSFQSPADISLDTDTTTYSSQITSSSSADPSLEANAYFLKKNIVADDWLGYDEINLDTSGFSGDTITYKISEQYGDAAISSNFLQDGDVVAFYTPEGNTGPGGISLMRCYYVFGRTIVGDNISFKISTTYGSLTAVGGLSGGSTTYGKHRILKGVRVASITSGDVITTSTPHKFSTNQRLVFITGATSNLLSITYARQNGQRNLVTGDTYRLYTVSSTPLPTTLSVGANINGGSGTATPGTASNFVGIFKIRDIALSNSVYIPQSNPAIASFDDGHFISYTISGTESIGGLVSGTTYVLLRTSTPNWYKIYKNATLTFAPADFINLYFRTGFAGNVYATTHTFSSTIKSKIANTIQITSPPRGNLNNNALIEYSTVTGTLIGGLLSNVTYRAKIQDLLIGNLRLRVGNQTTIPAARIFDFSFPDPTNSTTRAARNSIRIRVFDPENLGNVNIVSQLGLSAGSRIEVSGLENVSAVQRIFAEGLFTVASVSGTTTNQTIGSVTAKLATIIVSIPTGKNTTPPSLTVSYTGNQTVNSRVSQVTALTSAGGPGTHSIIQSADGAADDIYEVSNSGSTSFDFNTSVTVPVIVKNVPAVDVNVAADAISFGNNHNFADGTAVVYTTTGDPIGGLVSGNTYYVRVLDGRFIALAISSEDAIDRENGALIDLNSQGTGTHTFTTQSVKGFITGTGTINISTESNLVFGTQECKFFTDFSNGDIFRIYVLGSGVPGSYFESKVVSVKSDRVLKLENNPPFSSSAANYFVPTTLYALSDGKSVHRPFDGGVNITAGLIPNSQIIRQTRKYFRYQSGKGIQVSMAVNFNPTFDIDKITPVGSGTTTYFNINCKFPHQLSPNCIGSSQRIKISGVEGVAGTVLNDLGPFPVVGFDSNDSDFTFILDTGVTVPSISDIGGFAQFNVVNWIDCSIKCGLMDDQNGFFYEYDGSTLYAVRRSSTQQISGTVSVERSSHTIRGTDSLFLKQLTSGDRIIIRGQTYKVIQIFNDNSMDVQPAYRGSSTSDIVISKVIDTRVPQSEWNLDRMDGTGVSGYNLNINRIQMIYMDYSWYGAGTIRFGFKDQFGEVRYCHEFYHNNVFTESYMRSGNVPARYEVQTFDNPLFSPSLFHWGVSVIMDGRFDDDKSYLFTAESKALPFTNGGASSLFNGTTIAGSNILGGIAYGEFNGGITVGEQLFQATSSAGTTLTYANIQPSTFVNAIEVDGTVATRFGTSPTYRLVLSKSALTTGSPGNLFTSSGTADSLKTFVPLVSIRLAPSVDNANTGNLGFRDIINRMQLTLKSAGVLTTHDCEVRLILNPKLSNDNYSTVGSPSLSQIYRHEVGDTYTGGTNVFAFRAQGGGVLDSGTGRRALNVTSVSLDEIALLGNSILGGDGVFPDGPDVLTVAVRPIDTTSIKGSSPYIVAARITWAEAQA